MPTFSSPIKKTNKIILSEPTTVKKYQKYKYKVSDTPPKTPDHKSSTKELPDFPSDTPVYDLSIPLPDSPPNTPQHIHSIPVIDTPVPKSKTIVKPPPAPADTTSSVSIAPDTIKRLARDVRHIRKNPLTDNNIYYQHHDEDLLKGYAMIIGPSDTVYAYGFYFFEIDYPTDYPASPPKVTFKTNQDKVRFNPNLYTSGKVCLSMLNTWRGEQWSSCQTISSMLLTICTLFTNTPLLNEPGVNTGHRDFNTYNKIIKYKNIEIAIMNIIDKHESLYLPFFDHFYDDLINYFKENLNDIHKDVNILLTNMIINRNIEVKTSLYSMHYILKPKELRSRFNIMYKKYSSDTNISKCPPTISKLNTNDHDNIDENSSSSEKEPSKIIIKKKKKKISISETNI